MATDASAEQIAHAVPTRNVEYWVATADSSGMPDRCADLITVAQALHWLEHDAFYREVRRVAVNGGVLAAWSYGACHAGDDIEELLREFEHGILGPYWNAGRKWVDEGYRTIPFPFAALDAPAFELHKEWTASQLGEYLRSWSAVAKYVRERGTDPVVPLLERLSQRWSPDGRTRMIRWPLALRVGRIG